MNGHVGGVDVGSQKPSHEIAAHLKLNGQRVNGSFVMIGLLTSQTPARPFGTIHNSHFLLPLQIHLMMTQSCIIHYRHNDFKVFSIENTEIHPKHFISAQFSSN